VKRVLLISDRDNVATALEPLDPETMLEVRGANVTVREPIPRGHKVALVAITAGQPVVKYGNAIGRATADIPAGAHVHAHNVASDRGRGDLAALAETTSQAAPRLAEPPDEGGSDPNRSTGPGRRIA
jgi:hypothetical protein